MGAFTATRIRSKLFIGVVTATVYGSAHTGFSVSECVDTYFERAVGGVYVGTYQMF